MPSVPVCAHPGCAGPERTGAAVFTGAAVVVQVAVSEPVAPEPVTVTVNVCGPAARFVMSSDAAPHWTAWESSVQAVAPTVPPACV